MTSASHDQIEEADAEPLRDFYCILWAFERVASALDRGLLNEPLYEKQLAYHAVWWDLVCYRISDGDTGHRRALRDLAAGAPASLAVLARGDFELS